MKFQSAFMSATYVIRQEVVRPNPITGVNERIQKGLRAKFIGPQRIFDSVTAQQRLGWTDDERLEVERHLLKHYDFGRSRAHGRGGLYLAPNEVVPPEHAELIEVISPGETQAPAVDPVRVCIFVYTGPDDVEQCGEPAALGEDYCQAHLDMIAAAEGAAVAEVATKTKV